MKRCLLAVAALVLSLPACGPTRDLTVQVLAREDGSPISSVRVQVDNGAWQLTDPQGTAVLHGVGPQFVLRIHQTTDVGFFRFDDVWALQSPDGDRVVIRSVGSHGDVAVAGISGSISGSSGGPVNVVVGSDSLTASPMPSTQVSGDAAYDLQLPVLRENAEATMFVVRALEPDAARPGHYLAYGERTTRLTDPQAGLATGISVTLQPVEEATVSGSTAIPQELAGETIEATKALRFPEGSLWLGSANKLEPLTAVFPLAPGAASWLRAGVGLSESPPGVTSLHERRVTATSADVAFNLPVPVTLVEPAEGTAIDARTVFRWSGGPEGGHRALLVTCEWVDQFTGVARKATFRLDEGTSAQASLPALSDLSIAAGASCTWSVAWYPIASQLRAFTLLDGDADAGEARFSVSRRLAAPFR